MNMTDPQTRPQAVRVSPQLAMSTGVEAIMRDVLVALIPALGMAVFLFGPRVLVLAAVSMATCVACEALYQRLMGRPSTVRDGSACVTGLLLAMCLPVTAPYWAPVVGGAFAIVVVKQFFGGLGKNFMNPALAGRMLLSSFPGLMTHWADAMHWPGLLSAADAVSSATPLSYLHNGQLPPFTLSQLFMGQHGGSMGEVSAFMLILGGIYLVGRKVITPRIPLYYLGTVALLTLVFPQGDGNPVLWMVENLLSGGLLLGAIFMATDYTTSPITPRGQCFYAVGCGVLTVLLRYFGSYPEGVGFAVLVMNLLAWPIDRAALTLRSVFRRRKEVRA